MENIFSICRLPGYDLPKSFSYLLYRVSGHLMAVMSYSLLKLAK